MTIVHVHIHDSAENPVVEAARSEMERQNRESNKRLSEVSERLCAKHGVSRSANGLLPDVVKNEPEWKTAFQASLKTFQALRAFNTKYKPSASSRR